MAFTNGQDVTADDLNDFSITTITTTGNATIGGSVTVAGVGTINSSGKIPAISSTYFASLSGANLTNVPSAVFDRDVTVATVENTTTETTVYTKTIPGGTLSTNRMLRVLMLGVATNSGGGGYSTTVRVKFGGTTIATHVYTSISSTADVMALTCQLVAKNSASAQMAFTESYIGQGGASDGGDGQVVAAANAFHYVGVHNGVAVDSSTDQTLAITIQQSHNSLISATCEVVQVELV